MLVPGMIGKSTCPLHVWGPQEGRQRLSSRTHPVLKISCSCWDRLLTEVGDLGQMGVSRTLQMVISLSAGKATSGRAYLLPRRGWLEVFMTICSSAAWAERTLCHGQIYLGSFVLVRAFRPSFDLIYLLILELYYVQDSAALFLFFFLCFAC